MSAAVAVHHVLDGPAGAPEIVLSASLGTTHAMWEPQRAVLAANYRLVRYDYRGHGASPVPPGEYSIEDLGADALALLDRLDIGKAAWCGISLGGMVGLWLAINAPERISQLIAICSSSYAPPPSRWLDRAAAVRAAGSVAAVADAVLDRWFTAAFNQAHPDVVERAATTLRGTPAAGYAGCCSAIADLDLRAGLPQITAPTLVIAAAQDTALPPDHGEAIAGSVPGARYELVEQAAHLASIEQADIVNQLIIEHISNGAGNA